MYGVKSNKLDRKESEPVERMAEDAARVSIVTTARHGRAIGVTSTEYRAAVGRLSDATGAICRKLRRAGGVGTDLWDTVTRADACIKAHAPTDAHGWDALRDMLACNVPNPRWAVPGGLTPEEEREHNKLLDASITEEWGEL